MEPFGFVFGISRLMFLIVPLFIFGILAVTLLRGAKQWHRDEQSPRLTVEAKVVSKRTDYHRGMNTGNNMHTAARTSYYATFEFESGDRMELELQGNEYGMLVEGDKGKLTFQGSRYLGFQRM